MANALYANGKKNLLNGNLDLDTHTIKCAALTAGYAVNLGTHEFYSDLTPASNVKGTPQTLGSISVTGGVFDAADITFTDIPNGQTITQLVIYRDTGVAGTSPLLTYIDTTSGGALNITSNGGSITVQWDNGPNKIFAI